MVATCFNLTGEVTAELKSLITSLFRFSLWILSDVKKLLLLLLRLDSNPRVFKVVVFQQECEEL